MSRFSILFVALALALLAGGGTCEAPPPWRSLVGTFANASFGPDTKLGAEALHDVDVVFSVDAAQPLSREPLPVRGVVCVTDRAGLGLGGVYNLDPERSTWAGSDYGGARLDLVATAPDGRTVEIDQAFMSHRHPDRLDDAILTFTASSGTRHVFRFEDFLVSAALACP